jgi:hypothetical protein
VGNQAISQDAPETSLAAKLLLAINAPVVVPEIFLLPHLPYLPYPLLAITLVATIGLFWYWFTLIVLSWRRQRSIFSIPMLAMRLIGDISAVGFGVFLFFSWKNSLQDFLHGSWSDRLLFAGLPILWPLVLVFFFGHDFVRSVPRKMSGNA